MIAGAPIWSDALMHLGDPFPGGTTRVDLAVIGGGLTGLSAAYHVLAHRPGMRVAVLEAERFGAGASGRTTGMVGPGVGQSLVALTRRLGAERARALYQATRGAVSQLVDLVAREEIDCELEMSGQLVVARSPGARARLRTLADLLERLDLPGERLDTEALALRLGLAPTAGSTSPEGLAALLLREAGILHPGRLLAGLASRVRTRGGLLWEGARVTAIGDARPVRLTLADGSAVIADDVVVATAGYTSDLGLLRGRVLPVHLQVLATEPLSERGLAAIGWQGREGVVDARRVFNYYRLTADRRIVFGGGQPRYRWGGNTQDGRGAARALDRLAAEFARTFPVDAELRVERGWTGVIGYVVDALPTIQRVRGRPGVIQVVGWCGHGVALAVASGAWVTHLLCEGVAPNDLPWFRDQPPRVPTEPARWLGFAATVGMMATLDRIA